MYGAHRVGSRPGGVDDERHVLHVLELEVGGVFVVHVGLLDAINEQNPPGGPIEIPKELDPRNGPRSGSAADATAHTGPISVGVAPGSTGSSSRRAPRVAPTDAAMTQTTANHSLPRRCCERNTSPDTAARAGSSDMRTPNTDARIRRSA